MPTPDQIEAVARAIAEHVHNVPVLYMDASEDYIGGIEDAARAAIAAHEATRPVVPSDEELANSFLSAVSLEELDEGRILAGIRAVRERLEGVEHE
jgi:hypothetical protein